MCIMHNIQAPSLVLQTSQRWLSLVLLDVSSKPFMKVDLVLRLFYMLGEIITDKVSQRSYFAIIVHGHGYDSTTSCLTGVIFLILIAAIWSS